MKRDDEVNKLMKVWFTVMASLTFCYLIIRKVPKGIPRLILLLPVISFFTFLPSTLSSIHNIHNTFFFITSLGSFKLLLLAFDQGPLSSPSLSLPRFIFIASLPIHIKSSNEITQRGFKSPLNYAFKALLTVFILKAYEYRSVIHPYIIQLLYCILTYVSLEITLVMAAIPARAILGLKMEPQFDDPYLSTSLQNFWGRRWNLMVPAILRPTIFLPVRSLVSRFLGKRIGLAAGTMSSFLVSGLMHEWLYYLMSRAPPTWEVTWFFVIHGICTAVEVEVKKALKDKWSLHPLICRVLTLGFVLVTAIWLFIPQIVRNELDLEAIREFDDAINFIKTVLVFSFVQLTKILKHY